MEKHMLVSGKGNDLKKKKKKISCRNERNEVTNALNTKQINSQY